MSTSVVVAVLIHCYSSLPPPVAITPLLWRWGQVESPSSSHPLPHQGERHRRGGGYRQLSHSGSFGYQCTALSQAIAWLKLGILKEEVLSDF